MSRSSGRVQVKSKNVCVYLYRLNHYMLATVMIKAVTVVENYPWFSGSSGGFELKPKPSSFGTKELK